jgi:hypothetical protein
MEVSQLMKKFLLLRCKLRKPLQSLASSPVPRPAHWSKVTAWLRKKFPHSWLTDWIARNTTHGLAMEEIPPTSFDADTTPHEDTVGKIEQPLLNPHHFLDDHLQLIFDMRRNLEDQLHNQSILNRHMDLLFDSLSGAPDKKRCPTCGQRFVFTYNNEGCPGSPNL